MKHLFSLVVFYLSFICIVIDDHQMKKEQLHFGILLLSVSITFFCCVRISSLLAKFFRNSLSSISITRYSSSCSLYFLASRLQWAASRYKFPIRFKSRARPTYQLCRHYYFSEKRSKERSCRYRYREFYRERRREFAFEWLDFMERLELARFNWGCCCFYRDFLEVTESLIGFFYCEGLALVFSLEYLGFRTDSTSVLTLRSGSTLGGSWAGLGKLVLAMTVLTVLLPACSLTSCFFFSMARCTSAKSSSLFSSSSSSSSSDGQEYINLLLAFSRSLLASSRNLAVSSLGWSGVSFCSLKARLARCLPSFSSSEERSISPILRSSSFSFRYRSPISFFLVRMSLSRTMWSKTAGLLGAGIGAGARAGARLGSSMLEKQRSSSLSLREAEDDRGGALICSSYRSNASCIYESLSLEDALLIQIQLLQRFPLKNPLLPRLPFPLLSADQLSYNQLQFFMLASSSFWLKASAFLLTFLGYASLHSLREGWSYSKAQLQAQFQVTTEFLGIVDALYLVSYSFGMAALGSIIHRVSLKTYIIAGLLLASASYLLFPLVYVVTGYFSPVLMAAMMCLNGFFQATGWPGMMGIFGNWFQKSKKGVLMGIWAMNANVGNIIASSLCNVLEEHRLSWVWNFAVTGGFAVAVAVLMMLLLQEKPEEEQNGSEIEGSMLTEEEREAETSRGQAGELQNIAENPQNLKYGIFSVMCLPRVPLYVLGYSCLKGCIYGLLFWLPIFFAQKGGDIQSEKGYISSMIDLGSLIGGTAVGFMVDRYNKRALFLSPLLLISSFIMFIVSFALTNVAWQYYVAMFLIGNCIGGPYNIIGTVIAIDIGNNIKEKGSVTKVSSLIEGSAAFFTAISMIFIPRIPFETIFYLFSAECIIATLALAPVFIQELRAVLASRQKQHLLQEAEQ